MVIRKATKDDAEFVAWTVLTALDMNTDDLQKATDSCAEDFGLYSWKNAIIASDDNGQPLGCIISYPGDRYVEMREYTWPRLWTDIDPELMRNTPHETGPGEYYLDSMAIIPEARGKELGLILMNAAIEHGRELGYRKFGLIVDVGKPNLHDYYAHLGFKDDGPIRFFEHLFTKMSLTL